MLFREKRQVVICIAAGAIVGGFLLFRYLPLQKQIKAVEEAKAAQSLALAKASTERAQLPVLKEQLQKLERFNEARIANARFLNERLKGVTTPVVPAGTLPIPLVACGSSVSAAPATTETGTPNARSEDQDRHHATRIAADIVRYFGEGD